METQIKDSGERREFDTGAVRDIRKGKGRCDLLPIDTLGIFLDDDVLFFIGEYVVTGSSGYLHRALNEFFKGTDLPIHETLLELSQHYEQGVEKYGERNWEKGLPISSFIDSGVRHYLKDKASHADERHDLAFLWNIFGALWTLRHRPEMQDLPKK